MSDAQVQAAQKAASPKVAGSAGTPSASTSKPDTSKEEAMETDADQATQKVTTDKKGVEVTTQRRSSCSVSGSWEPRDKSSSRTGKTVSTSQGSKSQPAKSGTAQVQHALKQAGGLHPPRAGLGPIDKLTSDAGKKAVDYRQEAFPAPTYCVTQPGRQTPERGTYQTPKGLVCRYRSHPGPGDGSPPSLGPGWPATCRVPGP